MEVDVQQSTQEELIKSPRKCQVQDSQIRLGNAVCGYKSYRGQGKAFHNLVAKSPRALQDMTVSVYINSYLVLPQDWSLNYWLLQVQEYERKTGITFKSLRQCSRVPQHARDILTDVKILCLPQETMAHTQPMEQNSLVPSAEVFKRRNWILQKSLKVWKGLCYSKDYWEHLLLHVLTLLYARDFGENWENT